jgi:glycosyltransferase involved in cell wall biosynthesis
MRSDRFGGKALVYFGLYNAQEAPGVHQKVMGVLNAAKAAGFETRSWAEPFSKTAPLRRLAEAISVAPESHVILRSLGFANLFLLPVLMRARRRGVHITIDVPSPNRVAVKEIWRSRQSSWRRVRTVAAFYVSGPWSLWPATRIVQYAPEGWWFRLGNRSRTVETGNGIDVATIEPRRRVPAWPSPRLQLIAVATLARWHGYDRLLRAVREFQDRDGRTCDVHVTIVGDGPALPQLRQLVTSLRLSDHVTLAGIVTGDALQVLYESAHLAVSSLGLHRIGLDRASVLKAREYCAIGIPFIASGADPDFAGTVPFRLVVSADENTRDLVQIFSDYDRHRASFDNAAERRYAEQHLDWRHKLHAFGLTS